MCVCVWEGGGHLSTVGLLFSTTGADLSGCCFPGHELASDSMSVGQTGLRNRATLNAMESPEPNRFTKAPSEYRLQYELSSFAWMFSQAVGGHSIPQAACIARVCTAC